jgi:hypothetical protein
VDALAAAGSRLRVLDALRQRDFRLLFAGQTVSRSETPLSSSPSAGARSPSHTVRARSESFSSSTLPGSSRRCSSTACSQRVPERMLSRVISMDWFGSLGLLPVGLGLWAVLSDVASPAVLIAASSAFCGAAFLIALSTWTIRAVQ